MEEGDGGGAPAVGDDAGADGAVDTEMAVEVPSDRDEEVQDDAGGGEEHSDDGSAGGAPRGDARKQRRSDDGTEVGAIQVDEQAPQVNRRFYLGLDRASARMRNARRRQERRRRIREQEGLASGTQGGSTGDHNRTSNTSAGGVIREQEGRASGTQGGSTGDTVNNGSGLHRVHSSRRPSMVQRMSAIFAHVSAGEPLVQATLVEDDEAEVVVAQRMGFLQRMWKLLAGLMCVLLILAILLAALLSGSNVSKETEIYDMPSTMPSMYPTYDPAPTLQRVQVRGKLRCGLSSTRGPAGEGFYVDLCRAVASVLLGDPNLIEEVPVSGANRFESLYNRSIDLSLYGDTHTVEREVREKTTGAGFTFSSPIYYDGIAYVGNATYVECAEEQKRYNECASLRICAGEGSTSADFVQSSFPSDFFVVSSSWQETVEALDNGTCNAAAADQSFLLDFASQLPSFNESSVQVGGTVRSKSPLAIVTRNDDREFSDVLNWVVQALYYGEEQGLSKNASLCQNDTGALSSPLDLNYNNAVYCVGNYHDIIFDGRQDNPRGMNQINNGTGMLFATPFGALDAEEGSDDIDLDQTRLDEIRDSEMLRCGIVVPDGWSGNISDSEGVVGMSVDYCKTVAAALFNGNYEAAEIIPFPEENGNSSFIALDLKTIDVLVGARVDKRYDLGLPTLGGAQFSTPYFYGNETAQEGVSQYALATRGDDALFSSFVNVAVLATIFAQENNIKRRRSKEMPLIDLFGPEFSWALRDAVSYSGSYDQLHSDNFGDVEEEDRGRNVVNDQGLPQIASFPGLSA
ncbi:hypothetical protein ACHAXT_007809 [Thalassiosira profunda]